MKCQLAASGAALLVSLVVIVIQRNTINQLKTTSTCRSKRSVEDQSMYIPVYAQVSKKAMKRICRQHQSKTTTPEPANIPSNAYRKHCSASSEFGGARLVGHRPNAEGTVVRDGSQWFVTEFHLGFNVLQFSTAKALNWSEPRFVRTLPYPFLGTDHTVHNGTIFYGHDETLVAYNFRTKNTQTAVLGIAKEPLFNSSESAMDIQTEEHGLWVLYRFQKSKRLQMVRLVPSSLKVVSTWDLKEIDISDWCNSFVRCGILYSVTCSTDGARLSPQYDFYQNMRIGGKTTLFPGIGHISSAQYDPRSRSLTLFSEGNIYSVPTS